MAGTVGTACSTAARERFQAAGEPRLEAGVQAGRGGHGHVPDAQLAVGAAGRQQVGAEAVELQAAHLRAQRGPAPHARPAGAAGGAPGRRLVRRADIGGCARAGAATPGPPGRCSASGLQGLSRALKGAPLGAPQCRRRRRQSPGAAIRRLAAHQEGALRRTVPPATRRRPQGRVCADVRAAAHRAGVLGEAGDLAGARGLRGRRAHHLQWVPQHDRACLQAAREHAILPAPRARPPQPAALSRAVRSAAQPLQPALGGRADRTAGGDRKGVSVRGVGGEQSGRARAALRRAAGGSARGCARAAGAGRPHREGLGVQADGAPAEAAEALGRDERRAGRPQLSLIRRKVDCIHLRSPLRT